MHRVIKDTSMELVIGFPKEVKWEKYAVNNESRQKESNVNVVMW